MMTMRIMKGEGKETLHVWPKVHTALTLGTYCRPS